MPKKDRILSLMHFSQAQPASYWTVPPVLSFDIWHKDITRRSFKSSRLQGSDLVDLSCLCTTFHRCWTDAGCRFREFGVQRYKPLMNPFWYVAGLMIGLKLLPGIIVCHERMFIVCSNDLVFGTCQSTGMIRTKVSQKDISQILIPTLLAFFLPILHPGATTLPGKKQTTGPKKRFLKPGSFFIVVQVWSLLVVLLVVD